MIFNASKYNENWNTKKLNELGTFARGKSKHRPRNDKKLFEGGGYPLVQTGDIKKSNLYINSHESEYNETGLAQSKLWDKGTLCITIAANIAETGILSYPMCFPDSVVGFIANKNECSEEFMYYVFNYIKKCIKNAASGSIQDNINIDYLTNLEFKIPCIKVQDNIVNILKNIDNQINCNVSIINKLDNYIELLYDQWFVSYEFKNESGKAYKSNNGLMNYDNQLEKEIPIGWQYEKIEKLCNVVLGGTPDTSNINYWNGSIKWLNSGEISNFPIVNSLQTITELGLKNSATSKMPKRTVVVSITGNIRASVLAVECCANQSVVGIIENNKIKSSFIYPYMKKLLKFYEKTSTGNCQSHINKKTVCDSYIVIPPDEILNNYYKLADNIIDEIINIGLTNERLINLRDILLPLLMNGQVTINE